MRTLLAVTALLLLAARARAAVEDPSQMTLQAAAEAGAAINDMLQSNMTRAEVNMARAIVDMLRAVVEVFAISSGVEPNPGMSFPSLPFGLGGGSSNSSSSWNLFKIFG